MKITILILELAVCFLFIFFCITGFVLFIKPKVKSSTPYVNDKSEVDNLLEWDGIDFDNEVNVNIN